MQQYVQISQWLCTASQVNVHSHSVNRENLSAVVCVLIRVYFFFFLGIIICEQKLMQNEL